MKFVERAFIDQIRLARLNHNHPLVLGIGDDCAVFDSLKQGQENFVSLVSTDALVESVHFDLTWHPLHLLGRKALSVNLSDIAAMGGTPYYALLTIGVPACGPEALAEEFMAGFDEALQEYHVDLIGGDTVNSAQFFVSITVLGGGEKEKVLRRSRARIGDTVWVSGLLGQAAAGLEACRRGLRDHSAYSFLVDAHLDPTPQLHIGKLLANSGKVHAMMDLSDGIATDLAHLCKESGVGAEIYWDQLPLSKEILLLANDIGLSAHDMALTGGEDYHLLFTAESKWDELLQSTVSDRFGQQIFPVGRIVKEAGVRLIRNDHSDDISYTGFEHFS